MDDKTKKKITTLKNRGLSYRRISFLLDVPLGTVKNLVFRKRHKKVKTTFCKCCGNQIEQVSGKKQKIFCNDDCRRTWWNEHKDLVKRKNPHYVKCPICGKIYVNYGNQKKKYCSQECYRRSRWVKQQNIFTD